MKRGITTTATESSIVMVGRCWCWSVSVGVCRCAVRVNLGVVYDRPVTCPSSVSPYRGVMRNGGKKVVVRDGWLDGGWREKIMDHDHDASTDCGGGR